MDLNAYHTREMTLKIIKHKMNSNSWPRRVCMLPKRSYESRIDWNIKINYKLESCVVAT